MRRQIFGNFYGEVGLVLKLETGRGKRVVVADLRCGEVTAQPESVKIKIPFRIFLWFCLFLILIRFFFFGSILIR